MTRRVEEIVEWLRSEPPFEEVCEAFPDDWNHVQHELGELSARGELNKIEAYLQQAGRPLDGSVKGGRRRPRRELISLAIRRYMAAELFKRAYVAASSGRPRRGRQRFSLVNGYVAQKLLFERDLQRKPVSLFWFEAVWPLLTQRRLLMPLVIPKGIYCFYSKPLLRKLAHLIGDRKCLEIAAGDGTLSRLLTELGTRVIATDDYSWGRSITYPEFVKREDARTALGKHRPAVVICSWPPPGNDFEKFVFTSPTVELYVVISSRQESSAGNWHDYREQSRFELEVNAELGKLVLPPELDSAVYIFRRRGA